MRIQELRILYIAVGIIVVIVGVLIYNELTQTSEDKYIREMTQISENVKGLLTEYKQETDRVIKEAGLAENILGGDLDMSPADYIAIDERLQSYATTVGNSIHELSEQAGGWKYREEVPEEFQVRHDSWIESIQLIADWLITYGRIGTYRDPRTQTYRSAPNPDFLRSIYRREVEGFISYITAKAD